MVAKYPIAELNSNTIKEIHMGISTAVGNSVKPREYVEINIAFTETYDEIPSVIITPKMNGKSIEISSRKGFNFNYAVLDVSTTECKIAALNISDDDSYPFLDVFVI